MIHWFYIVFQQVDYKADKLLLINAFLFLCRSAASCRASRSTHVGHQSRSSDGNWNVSTHRDVTRQSCDVFEVVDAMQETESEDWHGEGER